MTAAAKLEKDAFRDESMNVPLCGEPGYQHPDGGDDFYDPRFAGLDTRGSGVDSKALKAFLSNPDRESILDTRDPELVAEYNRQHTVSVVQCNGVPFQVYQREGKWRAKGVTLDGTLHRFTGDIRDEVLDKLAKLSQQVQRDAIRELTRSQEIEIARLCQSGNPGEGMARYLEYRIGMEKAQQYWNEWGFVSDPELQGVMAECAYFCWLNSRADVQDSQEFRDFVQDYAGTRPINFDVLSEAYKAFGPHKEKQSRADAVARFTKPEEPSAQEIADGLENMTDEQVQKQFWAVARAAR